MRVDRAHDVAQSAWLPVHAGRVPHRRVVVLREQVINARLNATDCNVTISSATDVNTHKGKAGVEFLSGIDGNVPRDGIRHAALNGIYRWILVGCFALFIAGYDKIGHPKQGALEFRVFDRRQRLARLFGVAIRGSHGVFDRAVAMQNLLYLLTR